MEDLTSREEKQDRFTRLLKAQDDCVWQRQQAYEGRTLRVLIDGPSKDAAYPFLARTEGGLLVCCAGDGLQTGEFAWVKIEKATLRCLFAREVDSRM